MTEGEKTLEDLEGWKKLFTTRNPLTGSTYTAFLSPDETKLAQVHLEDGEVAFLFNRKTKKAEYVHPTTLLGMKTVGITVEELEARMAKIQI